MSELDPRRDEIFAIRSIFEDNLIFDDDCCRGIFSASPCLPDPPLTIVYSKQSDQPASSSSLEKFSVEYLSPFEFQFELPENYPDKEPPKFRFTCEWLERYSLTLVCAHLDKIWKENRDSILYLWFDFLLRDLISFLDIKSPYNISRIIRATLPNPHYKQRFKRNYRLNREIIPKPITDPIESSSATNFSSTQSSSKMCSSSSVRSTSTYLYSTPGNKYYDRRAMFIRLGFELIERIKRYDSIKKKESFEKAKINCGICFESFFGSETVAFGCDHYYCSNCIKTYLETHISDGQVHSLMCPFDKCGNTVDHELVKLLVKPEIYQKFDSLLLSSAICKLDGIIYCPRVNCLKPIITEHDPDVEKLVHCPYCDFAFCTSCKMSYHGVDPCKSFADEEEKVIILKEYDEAGPEKRKAMEKEYGQRFLFQQLQDFKNKSWLKDNSKQCPSCAYSIQKIDGCNKIHCFRCNCNFCWLCLSKLRTDNPYLHFRDKNSPCFAKLFEGVIQDEDTDDDDEWEEMDEDFVLHELD